MQPISREQLHRNRYLRTTSFEGKSESGDSFRRAKGDRARALMAPSDEDGAGEHLSSPITVIIATTASSLGAQQRQQPTSAEDADSLDGGSIGSSNASSPPTHPAFFSPGRRVDARGAGKENVCPSPMAVSFSPMSSPLARLVARKSPVNTQKNGHTGSVMLGRFIGDHADAGDEDGDAGGSKMEVLGNIDINVLAALPKDERNGNSEVMDTAPQDATSKKNKRKSKKTNGVNGADTNGNADEQVPPQPTSYAEAVKEDPVMAEKREAAEAEDEHKKNNNESQAETPSSTEKDVEKGTENDSKPTPAGGLTFAEAVKENPPANEQEHSSSESKEQSKASVMDEKTSDQSTPVFSQASTSIEYPEIHSDADDDKEEEEQRRRDKEKAPQVFGTRWAPVRVPFKRRLQTAAVLMHCLGIGLTLSIFFFLCAVPFFWPIIIIYLFSILFSNDAVDGKLKKRKEWVRRLPIWTYFAEYFPAKLHKTHDLQPTRKYIFGYHPHGIISHGAWAAFATDALGFSEKFPGITNSLLTLDSNFRLPLYREYVFSMGVLSVSKESITNILTRGGPNNEGMGRAVTIVVGGARESLEAQPKTMRLIINERKGFIKVALQTGADIVPVIAFGENDLYDQLDPHRHPWLHGLQRYFLKAWKFTVPLLHGRGIFNYDVGLMPYRRPLNIVVGKPIAVMQAGNPDNSEVDRLHRLYTEELQKIWDTYKDEFAGDRKEEMQFLD